MKKKLGEKKGKWAEELPFVLWADRTVGGEIFRMELTYIFYVTSSGYCRQNRIQDDSKYYLIHILRMD